LSLKHRDGTLSISTVDGRPSATSALQLGRNLIRL
jgi:hypothetical protein